MVWIANCLLFSLLYIFPWQVWWLHCYLVTTPRIHQDSSSLHQSNIERESEAWLPIETSRRKHYLRTPEPECFLQASNAILMWEQEGAGGWQMQRLLWTTNKTPLTPLLSITINTDNNHWALLIESKLSIYCKYFCLLFPPIFILPAAAAEIFLPN